MGTNYYLIKKCNKEEFDRYKGYNDDFEFGDKCTELTNGFVYRNTYYPTKEDLLKDLALTLHIGKSSCGWHFSLCIYPELGINNLDDWKKLFSEYKVYDEYNRLVSAGRMLDIITNRSNKEFIELGQEAFEEKVLHEHNSQQCTDYEKFNSLGSFYFSYESFLEEQHAERGLNGLLAHKDHIRTDGTYDLTTDWNFC